MPWEKIPDSDQELFNDNGYISVYGELTKDGLKKILKEKVRIKQGKVFVDLGSGNGNVTVNAMKMYPQLELSLGIELSQHRYNKSLELLESVPNSLKNRIKFFNKDIFDDGFNYEDFDIIYISNLCFPEEVNNRIGDKVMSECKRGTDVFCSKPLSSELDKKQIEIFDVCQTWTNSGKMYHYKV